MTKKVYKAFLERATGERMRHEAQIFIALLLLTPFLFMAFEGIKFSLKGMKGSKNKKD